MLQLKNARRPVSNCKICNGGAYNFDVVDFNKFCDQTDFYQFGLSGEPIYYLRCENCGFIFTRHFDHWSPAQFSRRIYNEDYLRVDGEYAYGRPTRQAERFAREFPEATGLAVLDYGSGTGVFADELKKRGFTRVSSYDPFSSPNRPTGRFDLITSIEVVEHTPDPFTTLRDILSFANDNAAILFTTLIQPNDIEEIRGTHWYLAPRNGHVSFYSQASLCEIAKELKLKYVADPRFHIMAVGTPPISITKLPLHCVTLKAPNAHGNEQWNELEHNPEALPGRWTKLSTISWRLKVPAPVTLIVSIPYLSEIQPGFSAKCKIVVDDISAPLSIERAAPGHMLKGTLDVLSAEIVISLQTPEPIRPCDIKASSIDRRNIGLFVLAPTG